MHSGARLISASMLKVEKPPLADDEVDPFSAATCPVYRRARKMDKTSILGDTIDYMKELLERINNLQQEMQLGSNELSLMSIFNPAKPNEILVKKSPSLMWKGEMKTQESSLAVQGNLECCYQL